MPDKNRWDDEGAFWEDTPDPSRHLALMSQPKLEIALDRDVILCPRCSHSYLHHRRIEIYDRSEDQDKGLYAAVDSELTVCSVLPPNNPSSRRHGIRIYFWCEGCGPGLALTIAQHKGETFVKWELRMPPEKEIIGDTSEGE